MFLWIAAHWSQIGVLASAIVFVWRAFKFFTTVTLSVSDFLKKLDTSHSTIQLLATNHLPHLQVEMETINSKLPDIHKEMEKANGGIEAMRGDFKSLTLALLARGRDE